MTEAGTYHFHYLSGNRRRVGSPWTRLDESHFGSTLRQIRQVVGSAESTPTWADDLLRVARAIFLVDKRASRASCPDRWTRTLHLRVEVVNEASWQGETVGRLEELLRVLTGDRWHVDLIGGGTFIDDNPRIFPSQTVSEVVLFSGGLDSTAHLVSRIQGSGSLLWIGHDIGGARPAQRCLHHRVVGLRSTRMIMAGEVTDQLRREAAERSSRSRGLLFAASAVFAAAAHGVAEVAMPENGQLAVNPPLTPARAGACSTRSVHPWVLEKLNDLIRALGGSVVVKNPFLFMTKGDVCRLALEGGLTADDLAQTRSCGTHSARRQPEGNCGHCYPCLIRRTGLHSALGSDPTRYKVDLGSLRTPATQDDLRDLQAWAVRDVDRHQILADLPLPAGINLDDVLATLRRGQLEVMEMLDAHGLAPVRPPTERPQPANR
jgi:hypothetical protein